MVRPGQMGRPSGRWSNTRPARALVAHEFGGDAAEPPLAEPLATLRQLREQELDPEPPDVKPRFVRVRSRTGGSRSRTRTCVTGARARPRDSTVQGPYRVRPRLRPALPCGFSRQPPRSGRRPCLQATRPGSLRVHGEGLSSDRGYINSLGSQRGFVALRCPIVHFGTLARFFATARQCEYAARQAHYEEIGIHCYGLSAFVATRRTNESRAAPWWPRAVGDRTLRDSRRHRVRPAGIR